MTAANTEAPPTPADLGEFLLCIDSELVASSDTRTPAGLAADLTEAHNFHHQPASETSLPEP